MRIGVISILLQVVLLCVAATTIAIKPNSWVDIFLFNDELELLKYRIKLHSSFVSAFVILESNITYAGGEKPLYAANGLSKEYCDEHNIFIISIPYSDRERSDPSPWVRETASRLFLNDYVANTFPDHRIFHSDADELLDPEVVRDLDLQHSCLRTHLQNSYYGPYCTYSKVMDRGILFHSDSNFFRSVHKSKSALRVNSRTGGIAKNCKQFTSHMGWHISFAMSTEKIVSKMRSFSHVNDDFVQSILTLPDGERERCVECRVKMCGDMFARKGSTYHYDKYMTAKPPPLFDDVPFPGNPVAPSPHYRSRRPGLIVVHGFSHLEAYRHQADMFRLSDATWIVDDFDLILRYDSASVDHAKISEYFDMYPHHNKTLLHVAKAPNYKCGQFVALTELSGVWEQYEFVIWMNPDVFIVPVGVSYYQTMISNYMQTFYVTRFRGSRGVYNTDLIMFRPALLRGKNVFDVSSSDCMADITEAIYYKIVQKMGSYVELFDASHGDRKIDRGGVWHTHNFTEISAYTAASPVNQLPNYKGAACINSKPILAAAPKNGLHQTCCHYIPNHFVEGNKKCTAVSSA